MLPIDSIIYCDCDWIGYESNLNWFPFNPVDDFNNRDARENPKNIIKFRKVCPKCKESNFLKIGN
ncbi:MAG: hypothetical protein WD512_07015 [Candidatus Paceibacterota bacterium]